MAVVRFCCSQRLRVAIGKMIFASPPHTRTDRATTIDRISRRKNARADSTRRSIHPSPLTRCAKGETCGERETNGSRLEGVRWARDECAGTWIESYLECGVGPRLFVEPVGEEHTNDGRRHDEKRPHEVREKILGHTWGFTRSGGTAAALSSGGWGKGTLLRR